MYPVGTRVSYRFWQSNNWQQGVIESYQERSIYGEPCDVLIKRDGYRETAVMPFSKLAGGAGSAFVTAVDLV